MSAIPASPGILGLLAARGAGSTQQWRTDLSCSGRSSSPSRFPRTQSGMIHLILYLSNPRVGSPRSRQGRPGQGISPWSSPWGGGIACIKRDHDIRPQGIDQYRIKLKYRLILGLSLRAPWHQIQGIGSWSALTAQSSNPGES